MFDFYAPAPPNSELYPLRRPRQWYIGDSTKTARRAPEVAAVTPLDRMLIETDSPYMTPVPHRGERNDSAYVRLVAEKLAEWKGVPVEQLARATLENGKRLFRISE